MLTKDDIKTSLVLVIITDRLFHDFSMIDEAILRKLLQCVASPQKKQPYNDMQKKALN